MLFPAVSEMPHLRSHSSLVPIYVFLHVYVSEGTDIAALVKAGEVCGGPPSRSSFLGNHSGTKLIPCNSLSSDGLSLVLCPAVSHRPVVFILPEAVEYELDRVPPVMCPS